MSLIRSFSAFVKIFRSVDLLMSTCQVVIVVFCYSSYVGCHINKLIHKLKVEHCFIRRLWGLHSGLLWVCFIALGITNVHIYLSNFHMLCSGASVSFLTLTERRVCSK